VALAVAIVLALAPSAGAFRTEKLNFVANVSEDRVEGESEFDFAAAIDGVWAENMDRSRLELTITSDYDQSLSGEDEYDRLKTWVRYLIQQRPKDQWNPLIAVSTEGDHDLNQVQTLLAFGYRRHFGEGFVEITGGASKDVRTAEDWTGDIGALVSLERNSGRFTWTVNPELSYGMLGEVRYRDNRTLYSLSSGLSYRVTGGVGLSYRLQLNNTQGDDRRHQFLGISYGYKR